MAVLDKLIEDMEAALEDPDLDWRHRSRFTGSTNLSGVGPVHAADLCGRVTAMWLRIRRW